MNEINSKAKCELYHILTMVKVTMLDKEKMAEIKELSEDLMLHSDLLGSDYYRKLKMVVLEFNNRGWLVKEESH